MATNFYTQLMSLGAAQQPQTFNPTLGVFGRQINPLDNPYFGTAATGGGLGNADGSGLLNWEEFPDYQSFLIPSSQDDGRNWGAVNPQAFADYLQSRNLSMFQSDVGPGGVGYRWVQDPSGNIMGSARDYNNRDTAFTMAALAAAGLTGANIFGALGAGGGAAQTLQATGAMANPVPTIGGISSSAVGPGLSVGAGVPAGLGSTGLGASGGAGLGTTMGTAGSGISLGGMTAATAPTSGGFFSNLGTSLLNNITSNPLGAIRSVFDIGTGLYGMSLARDAAKQSDPFAPYRQNYAQMLLELEQNPSLIRSRPGFQAGIEAITRSNAARGYAGSGNESAILSRYAGDFYSNELARLGQFAGAGQTPGAGAFPAAQLTSNSLASIGYGLAPFLGGPR